ncbi:unnamed protein product [Phytophthora lilii]|uniref:Unnamed protein product n=1 Tax=Phytophthora lilii TaxID=2077276 RepID=A0A9W6XQX9_9STRA|nr:unnamed protein product [Phytophthora lilii]
MDPTGLEKLILEAPLMSHAQEQVVAHDEDQLDRPSEYRSVEGPLLTGTGDASGSQPQHIGASTTATMVEGQTKLKKHQKLSLQLLLDAVNAGATASMYRELDVVADALRGTCGVEPPPER